MSSWPTPAQTPEFAAKLRRAEAHLTSVSPELGALIRHAGPCDLAPDPDSFAVLSRAVMSQLISTAAAKAITNRLVSACGGQLTPARVAALSDPELKACGLSGSKTRTMRGVADAYLSDPSFAERLAVADDPTARGLLLPLFGVGAWTVDMVLIFSLGHLDVFPVGDLVIRLALKNLLNLAEMPSQAESSRLGAGWSPARSVAAWHLWRSREGVPATDDPLKSVAATPPTL